MQEVANHVVATVSNVLILRCAPFVSQVLLLYRVEHGFLMLLVPISFLTVWLVLIIALLVR